MASGPVKRQLRRGVRADSAQVSYDANSASKVFYFNNAMARAVMTARMISIYVQTAGTDTGDVTAVIKKVKAGQSIGDAPAIHSGVLDLKGDANSVVNVQANANLPPGYGLAIAFTGDLTAASGHVAVDLVPAKS